MRFRLKKDEISALSPPPEGPPRVPLNKTQIVLFVTTNKEITQRAKYREMQQVRFEFVGEGSWFCAARGFT
jgi:hypothetical protein